MLRPCPAEHRGRFRELGSKYDGDQTGTDEVGKQHDDAVVVKQLDLLAQDFVGSLGQLPTLLLPRSSRLPAVSVSLSMLGRRIVQRASGLSYRRSDPRVKRLIS